MVEFETLLARIAQVPVGGIVAIDGCCASGKSTLGARLSETLGCPLFHLDDFFLRPEQRTPERFAEPGGNVEERYCREMDVEKRCSLVIRND